MENKTKKEKKINSIKCLAAKLFTLVSFSKPVFLYARTPQHKLIHRKFFSVRQRSCVFGFVHLRSLTLFILVKISINFTMTTTTPKRPWILRHFRTEWNTWPNRAFCRWTRRDQRKKYYDFYGLSAYSLCFVNVRRRWPKKFNKTTSFTFANRRWLSLPPLGRNYANRRANGLLSDPFDSYKWPYERECWMMIQFPIERLDQLWDWNCLLGNGRFDGDAILWNGIHCRFAINPEPIPFNEIAT